MLLDTVVDVEASNAHTLKRLLGNVDFSKHCMFKYLCVFCVLCFVF